MTISAIAAMRYLKLFAAQREDKVLFGYVWKIIPFLWVYSFIIAILPILGISSYTTEPYNISCTINWTGSSLEDKMYVILSVVFGFGIPLLICITCYVLIFKQLTCRNNAIRAPRHMESRLVKTAFAVMLCFMLAWTPIA
ncbi:rhodopsin, G0-coupled-like [Amphiura filiformis]|uniref:rhodopsin, G0-coupled-like n=1 Tax=Amphiura filiformis TaxID=82378 RepID=UPI003B222AB6